MYTKGVKRIIRGIIVFGVCCVWRDDCVYSEVEVNECVDVLVYNNDNDVKRNG